MNALLLLSLAVLPSHVDDGARILSDRQLDALIEPQLAVLEQRHGVTGFVVTRDEMDPREPSEALARQVAQGFTGKWFVVIYYAGPRYLHLTGYQKDYPLPRERLLPVLQAKLAAKDDPGDALADVVQVLAREAAVTFTGARLRWWKDQTVEFLATLFAGLIIAVLALFKLFGFFALQRALLMGAPGARARLKWDAEAKAHGSAAARLKYGPRPRLDAPRSELRRRGYSDIDL